MTEYMNTPKKVTSSTVTVTASTVGAVGAIHWKFCPHCGKNLESGWSYCPGCGQAIGCSGLVYYPLPPVYPVYPATPPPWADWWPPFTTWC